MAAPALMYGRKYQQGVNVITTVAMISFHILAVAAFFFIDAGAIATAIALYFAAGMPGRVRGGPRQTRTARAG